MKRNNRLILLIGFFLAAVAFVGVVLLLGGGGGTSNPTGPLVTTSTIVVTAADVPLGTTLTADLVTTQEVKVDEKPVGAYTLTSEVIGRTVTTQLTKGQLVDANAFSTSTVNPDIARLLEPGRRAMSIEVDQVSGVGTLIKPGDRVDVVMAITPWEKFPVVSLDPETGAISGVDNLNHLSVKAIVQNVEVVGTLLPAPPAQESPPPTEGTPPAVTAPIVILAVTTQEAEALRFAQVDGTLTLVLRSPEDKEAPNEETTGITLRLLVDNWAVIPPRLVETVLPTPRP